MKKIKNEPTIEEDILLLQEKSKNSPISIEEILKILSGKRESLIILFLSVPFCQPLQIPGLSTPFGLAIAFIGMRMAFGKSIWLPKKISAKTISSSVMHKITDKILWILAKMNPWIYPRIFWLSQYSAIQIMNGLLISILGVLLALPLPTPFSNLMSAWSIFFLGTGLLKDDGVFILIGYFFSLCTFGVFFATLLLIKFIF